MNALALRNVGAVEITIEPDAFAARDEAIANATLIGRVSNHLQAGSAADALKSLKAITKAIEASRTAIKAPVLDLGKRIDTTAKQFIAEVEIEVTRLTGLLTAYEVEQRRIAAEEERKRQEEERKARAEEAARLAEINRLQRLAEQAALLAESEREREAAEVRRVAAEQAAAIERAAAAERQANLPAVIEPPKVSGTVVREQWTFEVEDLRAFAQAHPDLVDITVRRADVLQLIRGGCRQLAHARIFTETKVGVRL